MTHRPAPPASPPPRPGAIERLYVYWLVSTALLLLALIITTLYTRAALNVLSDRISRVEQAAPQNSRDNAPPAPASTAPATGRIAQSPRQTTTDAPPEQPAPAPKPPVPTAPPSTTEPAPTTATAPAATLLPTDAELGKRLARVLAPADSFPLSVTDDAAAEELLRLGYRQSQAAAWSGGNWSRLATLARLMSRDAAAEIFARRAFQAGDPLLEYAEISARMLLEQNRPQEALTHARHFAEQSHGAAAARVVLARIWSALGDPAAAAEALPDPDDTAALTTYDQLSLARVALGLHEWRYLSDIVARLENVPPESEAEYGFLRAVALIQARQRLVEALGILDYLSEHSPPPEDRPAAEPSATTAAAEPAIRSSARRSAGPSPYEIAIWRGVALLRGQQWEAAREAWNKATALDAGRPDAHYWQGVLEMQAGKPDTARLHLENALAASANFAPAWEALGAIALNERDAAAALECARKAISANPRRAAGHFLAALAHAKASAAEPAAAALMEALRLDPELLEEAKQAEVLTRLFSPGELEELARPATTDTQPSATAPASP